MVDKLQYLYKFVHKNKFVFISGFCLLIFSFTGIRFLTQKSPPQINLAAVAQTQFTLQDLLNKHTQLLIDAVKSTNTNQEENKAAVENLDSASVSIAKWFGSLYGEQIQNEVRKIWKDETDSLLRYTLEQKKGNNSVAAKELSQLSSFPTKLTGFLVQQNPKAREEELKKQITSYSAIVKTIIDTSVAKDYTTLYKQQQEALNTVSILAKIIVEDISGQFPDKFK